MSSTRAFQTSYPSARRTFLRACADVHAEVRSIRHPLRGPEGEALFLDVVLIGDPSAPARLVLGSGTHGVEGFCGSALQVDQLEAGIAERLPAGVSLLLLHAINPFGFAWRRRVNEDNVDLNRNFLDFDAPLPENPGYLELEPMLDPEVLSDEQRAATLSAIASFQRERGPIALFRAVSGGQYERPSGLQ
jgi:hypothetical protein